ncbi:MAG: RidA family protein [Halomonas sp.]|jgi:2-iminobutanoate/2-iminopropanoate deaminase|uniref:RidA family protein n=1 Tax=Billgrantia tianxiuensis TaxID=2497861 RepID=A0A6I6SM67_9GAMM|nr:MULTISPECIES: Rid family hydrolase [Halomonas]MDX5433713.1 RidA family protein [Halomonas sp.]QHC48970.1 RidA family protein [Halomonas tianxiuensis]
MKGVEREVINPRGVPDTLQYGFSQAVMVKGGYRVHLSGQVGVDAHECLVGPDLEGQTFAALDNIAAILGTLGGDLTDVVMMRIYIAEAARYDQEGVVQALRSRFPKAPPATSWVIVSGLSEPEWLIEIEAEAVLPD